ncbi:MAG: hypothetical protein ACI8ZB_003182 [Desulforhopalus sp.]|jgi:hypothetical protein
MRQLVKTTLSKSIAVVCLLFIYTTIAQAKTEQVPISIAGIVLGSDVTSYPDIIDSNFMKEVVVTDWHGFRNGVISYGICHFKDSILKIDMKYEDKSKKFYNTLLNKIKTQYGDPDTWSGDSFGLTYIWKWHFTDKDNNRVSLKIQYNAKDSNETIGNMVKLSYPDKIADERRCFMEMCNENKGKLNESRLEDLQKSDWSHLIPEPQK